MVWLVFSFFMLFSLWVWPSAYPHGLVLRVLGAYTAAAAGAAGARRGLYWAAGMYLAGLAADASPAAPDPTPLLAASLLAVPPAVTLAMWYIVIKPLWTSYRKASWTGLLAALATLWLAGLHWLIPFTVGNVPPEWALQTLKDTPEKTAANFIRLALTAAGLYAVYKIAIPWAEKRNAAK